MDAKQARKQLLKLAEEVGALNDALRGMAEKLQVITAARTQLEKDFKELLDQIRGQLKLDIA